MKRHAEEIREWEEMFGWNIENVINGAVVAIADSVKISVQQNFDQTSFEKNVRDRHTLINVNLEQTLTVDDAIAKILELCQCDRSIDCLDYFVTNLNLTREVQRLSGLVESKYLELQKTPGMVDEASRLRVELSKLEGEKIAWRQRLRICLC